MKQITNKDILEIIKSCDQPIIGCKCLKRIDSFNNFMCICCNIQFHANAMIAHMISSKHRTKYMQNYCMHYYTTLFHSRLPSDERNNFIYELSLQIEEEEGRQLELVRKSNDTDDIIKDEPEKKKQKLTNSDAKKMSSSKIFSQLIRSNQILKSLAPIISDISESHTINHSSGVIANKDENINISKFSNNIPVLKNCCKNSSNIHFSNFDKIVTPGNKDLDVKKFCNDEQKYNFNEGIYTKETFEYKNDSYDDGYSANNGNLLPSDSIGSSLMNIPQQFKDAVEKEQLKYAHRNDSFINFEKNGLNEVTGNNFDKEGSNFNNPNDFEKTFNHDSIKDLKSKCSENTLKKLNRFSNFPQEKNLEKSESRKNNYSNHAEIIVSAKDEIKSNNSPLRYSSSKYEAKKNRFSNNPQCINDKKDINTSHTFLYTLKDQIENNQSVNKLALENKNNSTLIKTLIVLKENINQIPKLVNDDLMLTRSNYEKSKSDMVTNLDENFYASNLIIDDKKPNHKILSHENINTEPHKVLLPSPLKIPLLKSPDCTSTCEKTVSVQKSSKTLLPSPKSLLPLPDSFPVSDKIELPTPYITQLPSPYHFQMQIYKQNNDYQNHLDDNNKLRGLLPSPNISEVHDFQNEFEENKLEIFEKELSTSVCYGDKIHDSLPAVLTGTNEIKRNDLQQNSDVSCTIDNYSFLSDTNPVVNKLHFPINIDIYNRLQLSKSSINELTNNNSLNGPITSSSNANIISHTISNTNCDKLNFIRNSIKNLVTPKIYYSSEAGINHNSSKLAETRIKKNKIMNLFSSDMFSKYIKKSSDNVGDSMVEIKDLKSCKNIDSPELPKEDVALVLEKKAANDNRHFKVSEMSLDLQMALQKYRSKKNNCKLDI